MKNFGKGMVIGLAAAGGGMLTVAGVKLVTGKALGATASTAVTLGAAALIGGVGFFALA